MSEQTLMKNSGLLRDMEHHYECLLGTLPGVVYTLDEKGHFTYLSETVTGTLGIEREAIIGKHFSCVVHPGDLPSVSREYLLPRFEGVPTGSERAPKLFDERRSYRRRTSALNVRLCKLEHDKPQPESVYKCKVNASGQYDKEKQFCGTVGVIYDIVCEEQKGFPLDKYKGYNAFELLTHALSHVFSNVFTGIYGNLQLIEMQLEHPEQFSDNIEAIKHSIENAVSLIKKMSATINVKEKLAVHQLRGLLVDEAGTLLDAPGLEYRISLPSELWVPAIDISTARHIVRALFFHIIRSVDEGCVLEITAQNCTETPVMLPRIDCSYIKTCFAFSPFSENGSAKPEEQFSALERIASLALSYELLKKVGGLVTVSTVGRMCVIDLYLPSNSPDTGR